MTRTRRAGAVALGLVAILAALLASQPLWVAPLVSRYLSQTSGRSVHFDSIRIGLTPALEPVATLRGVRVANADWADPGWPMADVPEAIAVFSWRSIPERRPVIGRMVLRDGRVDLERQADGLRNWRLRRPDDRGPGRYKVLSLQAERCEVRFVHRGIRLVMEARSSAAAPGSVNAAGAPLPTRIVFQGEWRDLPYTADFASAATLTFLETDELFPIRGQVRAGGASLDLDGRAGDLFRAPRLDAELAFSGQSLTPFRAFFDAAPVRQPNRPYRIAGHAVVEGRSYTLESMRARVGASDLAGRIAFAGEEGGSRSGGLESAASAASALAKLRPGGEAPASRGVLTARLASELFDVADLEWLIGRSLSGVGDAASMPARPSPAIRAAAAGAAASATSTASQARSASAPPAASAPAADRPLDAEVAFAARRLRWARFPIVESARFEAASRDERVVVPTFEVGLGGGTASGSFGVDRSRQPLQGSADVRLRGLRLETLLPAADEKKRLTGRLSGQARLAASGATGEALLRALSGSVDAEWRDGSIPALLDAQIGLQGGRMLRSWLGGPSAVPVRCGRLGLDIAAGRARLRGLVLDTARTVTRGSGGIDLAGGTLDIVLTPDAKDAGVLVIDRSIRLHGPLARPERELVPRVEIPKAACAVAP